MGRRPTALSIKKTMTMQKCHSLFHGGVILALGHLHMECLAMKTLLFTASIIAMISSAAVAADLAPQAVEPVAPVVMPLSWTGFYVGAELGYGWGTSPAPYGFTPGGPYDFQQNGPDQKGFVGGGFVGYNYQIGQFVIGAEGDFQYSDIHGDDNRSGGDVNGLDANWQASARLRLGYAVDRFLPYITGGVAFLNTDATAPFSSSDTLNLTGWTIGAGLEYAFTDNIIGRIEYRYSDYGKKEASFPNLGYYEEYHPKHNTVEVGISYKF